MRDSFLGALLSGASAKVDSLPMTSGGNSWLGGIFGSTGNRQIDAMEGNATLFSIVNKTSNATAKVEWHLHRKLPGSVCPVCEETDVTHVLDHLALRVWNDPNEVYTRQEFVEGQQQHVDLTGEGWWVIIKNSMGWPEEIWPIRPDRMAPVPYANRFGVVGYMYTGPSGEKVPLERDEVIMLRMPNPGDPYRGLGVVQTLLTDLDSARYSADWNRNFFVNSAEPGGVIEFPDGLDDEQWRTFMTRWREMHKGVRNAHRVAIIERGKWVPRTFSMKDMQFTELRKLSRDIVIEAFGFPKFGLGIVDDVNRANSYASKAYIGEEITIPRLERFKQALNKDFLPMFGPTTVGTSFAYANPVPPDPEARNAERESKATVYKTLIDAGVDPVDAAEIAGLPPMRNAGRVGAGV